jgi:hypothetical protein
MGCFRHIIVNSLHKEVKNNDNNYYNNNNVTNLDPKITSSRRVYKCSPVTLPLDLNSGPDFVTDDDSTTGKRFDAIFDSPYIY